MEKQKPEYIVCCIAINTFVHGWRTRRPILTEKNYME